MGEYEKFESMGEYGWWGNFWLLGNMGSWVKYRGNMKGMGKCVGMWGGGGK